MEPKPVEDEGGITETIAIANLNLHEGPNRRLKQGLTVLLLPPSPPCPSLEVFAFWEFFFPHGLRSNLSSGESILALTE
jgi:hypothetical protein